MHLTRNDLCRCMWLGAVIGGGLGNVGPDLYDFVYNDVPAVFNDVLLIHTGTMFYDGIRWSD